MHFLGHDAIAAPGCGFNSPVNAWTGKMQCKLFLIKKNQMHRYKLVYGHIKSPVSFFISALLTNWSQYDAQQMIIFFFYTKVMFYTRRIQFPRSWCSFIIHKSHVSWNLLSYININDPKQTSSPSVTDRTLHKCLHLFEQLELSGAG